MLSKYRKRGIEGQIQDEGGILKMEEGGERGRREGERQRESGEENGEETERVRERRVGKKGGGGETVINTSWCKVG